MAGMTTIRVAYLHEPALPAAPTVLDAKVTVVAGQDAGDVAKKAAEEFDIKAASGRLQLFHLTAHAGKKPSPEQLKQATEVDKTTLVSDRTVFYEGAWFRLDVIATTIAPQAGE